MPFSNEQIEVWQEASRLIPTKTQALLGKFIAYPYRDPKALEYAKQGFCRRVSTLARCIHNVFAAIPLERTERPSNDERTDATINIQAFLFNAFGSLDNLAHILVGERQLVRADGKSFRALQIGLDPGKDLRTALSPELSHYLATLDDWFSYLADFRHALAHRVPIYIPPYLITSATRDEYERLENEKAQAFIAHDIELAVRLDDAQDALGQFEPIMTHSPLESPGFIAFHREMLVDFHTIEEIAGKVLDELRR
ncbi:hypothetical protein GCM10011611_42530 [Aliidongia dinghuensis]|uniref:Cthe-2314-like HEPN domain-containing protein n=1 Tax=Aliidongia dinghuensis TaxID=1867774 RepID=A0A8J2YWF3_9PROT|nr:hypothetical protein [Aliidongia dinghuensis]GGF31924.1 hypothetical protein GCM10011611_42530 [Aliidongia dinghuensis]